jgi:hypothetical protein
MQQQQSNELFSFPKQKRYYPIDSHFFLDGNHERDIYLKSSSIESTTTTVTTTTTINYHEWPRCNQCNKMMFPTNYFLDIHITENHDPFFALKSPSVYKCIVSTCEASFSTPQLRYNHMHNVHRVPQNYQLHFRRFVDKKHKKQRNKMMIDE